MVRLKPVTRENLEEVLALRVAEGQEKYVISNAESLSRAYVYSETAYPFAIYDNDIIVGFIMMGYYEVKGYYTLWEFMIDHKYQNKGYGTKIVEDLCNEYGLDCLWVNADNKKAIHVYEKCGFEIKEPTMYLMTRGDTYGSKL